MHIKSIFYNKLYFDFYTIVIFFAMQRFQSQGPDTDPDASSSSLKSTVGVAFTMVSAKYCGGQECAWLLYQMVDQNTLRTLSIKSWPSYTLKLAVNFNKYLEEIVLSFYLTRKQRNPINDLIQNNREYGIIFIVLLQKLAQDAEREGEILICDNR